MDTTPSDNKILLKGYELIEKLNMNMNLNKLYKGNK